MAAIISSVKDPRIATVRELATVAGRRAAQRCLLEGDALIEQAVSAQAKLDFVLVAQGEPARFAGENTVHEVAPNVLRQAVRGHKPVTALAVAALPAENDVARAYGEIAVVFDGIADPGNLGTIVRTARGLGVSDIVCTDEHTDLTSRRVLETSRAAVLRSSPRRFHSVSAALESLHAKGFEVVVTAPHGRIVQSLTALSGAPLAVVVGNETEGVSAQALAMADHVVRIPMAGEVESFNVGVATGISLYELRARMLDASLERRCRNITFTTQLRADVTARLRGLDHLGAQQFEALVTAAAEHNIRPAQRHELLALWPLALPEQIG